MFLYVLFFNVNFFRWESKDAISVKEAKNHLKLKKEKQCNNNTESDIKTNQRKQDESKMVPIQDFPGVQSVFLPQFKMFPSTLN